HETISIQLDALQLGASPGLLGRAIIGSLTREMKRRRSRYGLASMCIGLGQGIATVWKRITI
ncbi:MAG TPA: acetyl-CoA C-acyltransferase, partial [bacterium]|nr:acetyl-CoA C-acyltransferase [bacterium]